MNIKEMGRKSRWATAETESTSWSSNYKTHHEKLTLKYNISFYNTAKQVLQTVPSLLLVGWRQIQPRHHLLFQGFQ